MRLTTIAAAAIIAIALTVGAGFGAAQVMRTDSAKAGGSRAVVKQLKEVNKNLKGIEADLNSVKVNTDSIKSSTGYIKSNTDSIKSSTGYIKSNTDSMDYDIGQIRSHTGTSIYSSSSSTLLGAIGQLNDDMNYSYHTAGSMLYGICRAEQTYPSGC